MIKINIAAFKNMALIVLCIIGNSVLSQTVKIGNQEWMAKDLNVVVFRNGDSIPEAKTEKEFMQALKAKSPVWQYTRNDTKDNQKYSIRYNWFAVNDPRGLAPSGYHVASESEWKELFAFLGGDSVAGKKIQSKTGWTSASGINSCRFNALPDGGSVKYPSEDYGQWFTSTEFGNKNDAVKIFLNKGRILVTNTAQFYTHPVRCLKDKKGVLYNNYEKKQTITVVTNTSQIIKQPVKIEEGIVFTDPKTEKMGLKDANGKVLLPADYFTIHSMNEFGLYPASKVPGIWGFINSKGKVVIPLIYQSIENFQDDSTSRVMKDEMMGRINTRGKVVVPIIYDMIEEKLRYNQYEVSLNGKKGSINRIGKLVVPIEFDDVNIVSENIIIIKKGDKYGLYTTDSRLQNKIIVPCIYDEIYGMAYEIFLVKRGDKWGLIGGVFAETIIPCEKQNIRPDKIGGTPGKFIFRDGKSGYSTETTIIVTKDGNGKYKKETIEIK